MSTKIMPGKGLKKNIVKFEESSERIRLAPKIDTSTNNLINEVRLLLLINVKKAGLFDELIVY